MIHDSYQKGIAVVLAVLILSGILAVAFGSSTLLVRELGFQKTAGFSTIAFFGADAGIEKILTLRQDPLSFTLCVTEVSPCTLSNGVQFWVQVSASTSPSCAADNYCIESTGLYLGTRRAIEVDY